MTNNYSGSLTFESNRHCNCYKNTIAYYNS
jgi:hypothetical protein